jgi:mycofactocin system transcriptional regulator
VGSSSEQRPAPRGRPPSTTRERIGHVALELFATRGFEETTVDDIADAVGVGRRTVFRYFPSKNDMVWGDFESVLSRLRADLAAIDPHVPVMEAIARAAVSSNRYDDDQLPELRIRLTLITAVPALQAHSMLRYADWRAVIAEYVAVRTGSTVQALIPQTIAHAALGVSVAAFSCWVHGDGQDLTQNIRIGYAALASGWSDAIGD